MKFDREILNCYNPATLYGVDEVGRGPLAGPVVAAACALWGNIEEGLEKLAMLKITDSKKLSSRDRIEKLSQLGLKIDNICNGQKWIGQLTSKSWIGFSIYENSVARVDEINILQASLEAMVKAFEILKREGSFYLLVDGNYLPREWQSFHEIQTVIKGDFKSLVIGAASIVAKEYRDALMVKLDQKWPGYGLARHAGYPTKYHREAIQYLGVSPCHRKTFKGVKEYL